MDINADINFLTPAEKKIKNIAFGLGVLQGLVYSVIAFLCMIVYFQEMFVFTYDSYMTIVNANMYYLFLSSGKISSDFPEISLNPTVFTGFAWTYFILYSCWAGISAEDFCKRRGTWPRQLYFWGGCTLVICLLDFIMVVILGSDYAKCLNWAEEASSTSEKITKQQLCVTGILPVLVILAKGFVLWFINVIFGVILYKMGQRLQKAHPSLPSNLLTDGCNTGCNTL